MGTLTTLTQTVYVTTPSTDTDAAAKCGLATGELVTGGANQQIQAVSLGDGGTGYACDELGNFYCSAGTIGAACASNAACDTGLGGDGACTEVTYNKVVKNDPFGVLTFDPDTSTEGMYGFRAMYEGGGNYDNAAPTICENLTVIADEECSGATITIDQADGPGEPTAPGGPYNWSFVVTVHACEDLYSVTAQGGTNGWAQLVNRSEDSLHPSGSTTAEIRNANKKADVILWTLGDMTAGQTETLEVDLIGSLKKAPDCQELFLSGAWSALFSTDGVAFEKSDYTGRVSVFTNSNGVAGDCGL